MKIVEHSKFYPWTSRETYRTAEEMDQADQELRQTISHIWPLQAKKLLDLLVPRKDELNTGKLTVGKIYAGLLILESWRNTKFGQIESDLPVSELHAVCIRFSSVLTLIIKKIISLISSSYKHHSVTVEYVKL